MSIATCDSCAKMFSYPAAVGITPPRRCEPCEEAARNAPTDTRPVRPLTVACEADPCVGAVGGVLPEAVGSFAHPGGRKSLCATCLRIARDSIPVVLAPMTPADESLGTPKRLAVWVDEFERGVLATVLRDRLAIDASLTTAIRQGDVPIGAETATATLTLRRLQHADQVAMLTVLLQLAPTTPQPELPFPPEGQA